MSVLKNRVPVWYKNLKNLYFQHMYCTARSPFSISLPVYGTHLQQTRVFGQIIPLCSLSFQNSLRPQLSRLFRRCPPTYERSISFSSHQKLASNQMIQETDNQELQNRLSYMNIRLVNENNFLSWCRNAYLSSVVGVAMITEGTTLLSQNAGIGALVVGTMNLFWGTTCHIANLVKLRNVSGMSGLTLFLNIIGSFLHCLLWTFVLICYIGFLDETSTFDSHHKTQVETMVPDPDFMNRRLRRKENEV